jgi:transglutaminase-like putative cysteine protease
MGFSGVLTGQATIAALAGLIASVLGTSPAFAAEAPKWMHALTGVALPAYHERTEAVELYSDTSITVQPNGKIKRLERKAYKILRPDGAKLGQLSFVFAEGRSRVTDVHAWCIPASGKDYAVKERDSLVAGLTGVPNGVLASDIRALVLQVPAAAPGNIIGYEVEIEKTLDVPAEVWNFQGTLPVRETHYSLQLPSGWSYKATWLNHAEESPSSTGANQWRWTLEDLPAVRVERRMPPLNGVAGALYVTLLAPPGQRRSIETWSDIGAWYADLARGRRDPSPQLKQKVMELTADRPVLLAKMQALAAFVQDDIRYVAIELGIGGYQPHAAADVFSHEYGDCKDKATLLGAMLEQIGVKSYPVIINASRGVVTPATPPTPFGFNHAILAVALPADLEDASIEATYSHPKLGKLLLFDPTNPVTPFGSLSGSLQGNYGLLVTPDGGELVQLPALPPSANGVTRTAALTLDKAGTLRGDVREVRQGDRAAEQRFALRSAKADTDRIRPIERLLSTSLSSYEITKASVVNLPTSSRAFEWRYSLEASHYGKVVSDVLLIRPRVVGSESRADLETREPREHPFEFEAPERDSDVFEIALPPGYQLDSLPQPVDVDDDFATYHSKTELIGRTLRYTRSYQIDKLSVPADKTEELRALFRIIEADERNEAVLKRAP